MEITAKDGDKRIYRPVFNGKPFTDHDWYGMECTVVHAGETVDMHLVHIDGLKGDAMVWANGYELEHIK